MPATGVLGKGHSQEGCEVQTPRVDSVHDFGDSLMTHVFKSNSTEMSITTVDSGELAPATIQTSYGDASSDFDVNNVASHREPYPELSSSVPVSLSNTNKGFQNTFTAVASASCGDAEPNPECEAEVENIPADSQDSAVDDIQDVPYPECDNMRLQHLTVQNECPESAASDYNLAAAQRECAGSVSSDCVYFIQATDASGQVVSSIINPNDLSLYADSVIYKQCVNSDGEIETTVVHPGNSATTQHQPQDGTDDAQQGQQIIYAHDLSGQLIPLDPAESAAVAPAGKQFVFMQDTAGRIIRTVMDASQNMVPGQQVYYTHSDDGQIITSFMDSSTAAAAHTSEEQQQLLQAERQVCQQRVDHEAITDHHRGFNNEAVSEHQQVKDINEHQRVNDADITHHQQQVYNAGTTDHQQGVVATTDHLQQVSDIGSSQQQSSDMGSSQQQSSDVDIIQHPAESKNNGIDRSASFSIDTSMSGLSMLAELSHLTSGQGPNESLLARTISQLRQTSPSICRDNLFLQWQNLDAMCWMDVVLIMLVHSPSLRPLSELEASHELASTLLVTLLKANRQAQILLQNLLKKHNGAVISDGNFATTPPPDLKTSKLVCKENMDQIGKGINVLYAMREKIWQALQPRLRCERGKHNSPVLVLPLLVRENPTVKQMFTMRYRYVFKCDKCSYTQDDSHSKILSSIPTVPADFNMSSPCFVRSCFACQAPNQRMVMKFEQLQDFVQLHFVRGLPHSRFDELSFDFNDDHYEVTAFVHYKNNPDHFIAWVRNAPGTMWMECDDLKSVITRYTKTPPNIPPAQVHMVMWERRLTPQHTLVMRDTEDTRLLASLVLAVQQPNTHHTTDADTKSSTQSSSSATPLNSTSLLSGLTSQNLAAVASHERGLGKGVGSNGVRAAASTAIGQIHPVAAQLSAVGNLQTSVPPGGIRIPLSAFTSSGLSLQGAAKCVLVGNSSQGDTLTRAGAPNSRFVMVRTSGGTTSISATRLLQLLQQSGQGRTRLAVAVSSSGNSIAAPTAASYQVQDGGVMSASSSNGVPENSVFTEQASVSEHSVDSPTEASDVSQNILNEHMPSAVSFQTISALPFPTLEHSVSSDTNTQCPEPVTSHGSITPATAVAEVPGVRPILGGQAVNICEGQQPKCFRITNSAGEGTLCQLAMKYGKMVLLPADRTAQKDSTDSSLLKLLNTAPLTTEASAGSQQEASASGHILPQIHRHLLPATRESKIRMAAGVCTPADQPAVELGNSNPADRLADPDSVNLNPANRLADPDSVNLNPANRLADPDSVNLNPANRLADPDSVNLNPANRLADSDSVSLNPANRLADPDSVNLNPANRLADSDSVSLNPANRLADSDSVSCTSSGEASSIHRVHTQLQTSNIVIREVKRPGGSIPPVVCTSLATSTDSVGADMGHVSQLKDVSAGMTAPSHQHQIQENVRYVHPEFSTTHILHTGTSEPHGSKGQSGNTFAALSSGVAVDGQQSFTSTVSSVVPQSISNTPYDNSQAAALTPKQRLSKELATTKYIPLGRGRTQRGGRGRASRGRGRATVGTSKAEPVMPSIQMSTLSDLQQIGARLIRDECEAVDGVPVVSIPDFSPEMDAQTMSPESNDDPTSHDTGVGVVPQLVLDRLNVCGAASSAQSSQVNAQQIPSATTNHSFNFTKGTQASIHTARQPLLPLSQAHSLLTDETTTPESSSSLLATFIETSAERLGLSSSQAEIDAFTKIQPAAETTSSGSQPLTVDVDTDSHCGDSGLSLDDAVTNTDPATEVSAESELDKVNENVSTQSETEQSDAIMSMKDNQESAAIRYRLPSYFFQPEEELPEKSVKLNETSKRVSVSLSPGMFQESEKSLLDDTQAASQKSNSSATFGSTLGEAEMEPESLEHTGSITNESVDVVKDIPTAFSKGSNARKGAGTRRQRKRKSDRKPELQTIATSSTDGATSNDKIAGLLPESNLLELSRAGQESPLELPGAGQESQQELPGAGQESPLELPGAGQESLQHLSSPDSVEQTVPSGGDGFATEAGDQEVAGSPQEDISMNVEEGYHNTMGSLRKVGRPRGRPKTGTRKRGGRKQSGNLKSDHSRPSATATSTCETVNMPLQELADTDTLTQMPPAEPESVESCTAGPAVHSSVAVDAELNSQYAIEDHQHDVPVVDDSLHDGPLPVTEESHHDGALPLNEESHHDGVLLLAKEHHHDGVLPLTEESHRDCVLPVTEESHRDGILPVTEESHTPLPLTEESHQDGVLPVTEESHHDGVLPVTEESHHDGVLPVTEESHRDRVLLVAEENHYDGVLPVTEECHHDGVLPVTEESHRDRVLPVAEENHHDGVLPLTEESHHDGVLPVTEESHHDGVLPLTEESHHTLPLTEESHHTLPFTEESHHTLPFTEESHQRPLPLTDESHYEGMLRLTEESHQIGPSSLADLGVELDTAIEQLHENMGHVHGEESCQVEGESNMSMKTDSSKVGDESNMSMKTDSSKVGDESNMSMKTDSSKVGDESNMSMKTDSSKVGDESNMSMKTDSSKVGDESNMSMKTDSSKVGDESNMSMKTDSSKVGDESNMSMKTDSSKVGDESNMSMKTDSSKVGDESNMSMKTDSSKVGDESNMSMKTDSSKVGDESNMSMKTDSSKVGDESNMSMKTDSSKVGDESNMSMKTDSSKVGDESNMSMKTDSSKVGDESNMSMKTDSSKVGDESNMSMKTDSSKVGDESNMSMKTDSSKVGDESNMSMKTDSSKVGDESNMSMKTDSSKVGDESNMSMKTDSSKVGDESNMSMKTDSSKVGDESNMSMKTDSSKVGDESNMSMKTDSSKVGDESNMSMKTDSSKVGDESNMSMKTDSSKVGDESNMSMKTDSSKVGDESNMSMKTDSSKVVGKMNISEQESRQSTTLIESVCHFPLETLSIESDGVITSGTSSEEFTHLTSPDRKPLYDPSGECGTVAANSSGFSADHLLKADFGIAEHSVAFSKSITETVEHSTAFSKSITETVEGAHEDQVEVEVSAANLKSRSRPKDIARRQDKSKRSDDTVEPASMELSTLGAGSVKQAAADKFLPQQSHSAGTSQDKTFATSSVDVLPGSLSGVGLTRKLGELRNDCLEIQGNEDVVAVIASSASEKTAKLSRSRECTSKRRTSEKTVTPSRSRGRTSKDRTSEKTVTPSRSRGRTSKDKTSEKTVTPSRSRGRTSKDRTSEKTVTPSRSRGRTSKDRTSEKSAKPNRSRGRTSKDRTSEKSAKPSRSRERISKHRGKRKLVKNSANEHSETSITFTTVSPHVETDGAINVKPTLHSNGNVSNTPSKKGIIFFHRKGVVSPLASKDIQKKAKRERKVKKVETSTVVCKKRKTVDWGAKSGLGNGTDPRASFSYQVLTSRCAVSRPRHASLDQKQKPPASLRCRRSVHIPPEKSQASWISSPAVVKRWRPKTLQTPEIDPTLEVIPLSSNRQLYPEFARGSVDTGSVSKDALTGVVMRRRQHRADWSCAADSVKASDKLTQEKLQTVPVKYCKRLISSLCINSGAARLSGGRLKKLVGSEDEAGSAEKDVTELEKVCSSVESGKHYMDALSDSDTTGNNVNDSENMYGKDAVDSRKICGSDVDDSEVPCGKDVVDSEAICGKDVVDSEATCDKDVVESEATCGKDVVESEATCGKDVVNSEATCGKDVVESEATCGKDVVNSEATCGKDVVESEATCGKDVVNSEANCGKDVVESEATCGKDVVDSEATCDKDVVESEATCGKDMVDSEAICGKDVVDSEATCGKDVVESEATCGKDVVNSEATCGKDVVESEAICGKDVVDSEATCDKDVIESEATCGKDVVNSEATYGKDVVDSEATCGKDVVDSEATCGKDVVDSEATCGKDVVDSEAACGKDVVDSEATCGKDVVDSEATCGADLEKICNDDVIESEAPSKSSVAMMDDGICVETQSAQTAYTSDVIVNKKARSKHRKQQTLSTGPEAPFESSLVTKGDGVVCVPTPDQTVCSLDVVNTDTNKNSRQARSKHKKRRTLSAESVLPRESSVVMEDDGDMCVETLTVYASGVIVNNDPRKKNSNKASSKNKKRKTLSTEPEAPCESSVVTTDDGGDKCAETNSPQTFFASDAVCASTKKNSNKARRKRTKQRTLSTESETPCEGSVVVMDDGVVCGQTHPDQTDCSLDLGNNDSKKKNSRQARSKNKKQRTLRSESESPCKSSVVAINDGGDTCAETQSPQTVCSLDVVNNDSKKKNSRQARSKYKKQKTLSFESESPCKSSVVVTDDGDMCAETQSPQTLCAPDVIVNNTLRKKNSNESRSKHKNLRSLSSESTPPAKRTKASPFAGSQSCSRESEDSSPHIGDVHTTVESAKAVRDLSPAATSAAYMSPTRRSGRTHIPSKKILDALEYLKMPSVRSPRL
ncbi:hypothetical protein BsWGS_24023 [Bradybaena similaris]